MINVDHNSPCPCGSEMKFKENRGRFCVAFSTERASGNRGNGEWTQSREP